MHEPDPAAVEAAHRLRLAAATAEVAGAFQCAGIQSILLKGAAIARWLYTEGAPRSFSDIDLLVRPCDRKRAQTVLAGLGFVPHVDEGEMHQALVQHATEWLRERDGAEVDLHRTLPGVEVPANDLWEALGPHTEDIPVGGADVRALSLGGTAFHLALHIAQHGRGEHGWRMRELERAIGRGEHSTWDEAAGIAARLGASGAMGAGLRMVPGGADLARRLGLPESPPVDVALRAAKAPPVALGFDQLARAQDTRARLTILRHKTIPPATFMQAWSPLARRGRAGLLIAYAWRPLWLLVRAPAGFRAWNRARRGMR